MNEGSRLGAVLVLVLVAAALAACGDDDDTGGPDAASGDGDADADSDADTDADSDTDADADGDGDGDADTGLWSMGYYASWHPWLYPIEAIEWSGLTHVAMAFYMPGADGSLELLGGDPQLATDLVAAARAHGVVPVASIGGADSAPAFRDATGAAFDAFVASLIALLDDADYAGIDIDWEPLETSDEPTVIEIANRLRAERPDAVLTIPVGYVNVNIPPDLSGYPAIAAAYDQVNLMSYGMAGAWEGWKSWHSSALYQEDSATPIAIDSTVAAYEAAGVPLAKLGVGIGFFGLCYTPPVTGPDQDLGGSTIAASDGELSYTNIMTSYFDEVARQWDALARVPYLSFAAATGPNGCQYISYDDEQSIAEKADYVRARGLGGVMQWEITEGYLPDAPEGSRSPLLLAIRDEVLH